MVFFKEKYITKFFLAHSLICPDKKNRNLMELILKENE